MQIRKFAIALAALAVMAIGQSSAQASMLSGTDSFGTLGKTTINGTNILNSTTFAIHGFSSSGGNGGGDFAPVSQNGPFTFGTPVLTIAANGPAGTTGTASFTFSDLVSDAGDSYGSFTGSTYTIVSSNTQGTSYSESIYVLGTFTPGSDPGYPTGEVPNQQASFLLNFTQAGTSVSFSGTLSVPPAPLAAPEPASVIMLGMGLVGFGGVALRRRMAK